MHNQFIPCSFDVGSSTSSPLLQRGRAAGWKGHGKFSVLRTQGQDEMATKCWQHFISHNVSRRLHLLTWVATVKREILQQVRVWTNNEKTKKLHKCCKNWVITLTRKREKEVKRGFCLSYRNLRHASNKNSSQTGVKSSKWFCPAHVWKTFCFWRIHKWSNSKNSATYQELQVQISLLLLNQIGKFIVVECQDFWCLLTAEAYKVQQCRKLKGENSLQNLFIYLKEQFKLLP